MPAEGDYGESIHTSHDEHAEPNESISSRYKSNEFMESQYELKISCRAEVHSETVLEI